MKAKLKRWLAEFYLRRSRVEFSDVPYFFGRPWPRFEVEGTLRLGREICFREARMPIALTVRDGATMEIGDGCYFNDGVNICATERVVVGDHCLIGSYVTIYDTDFHVVTPKDQVVKRPVTIGRNVWIGDRVQVLAGATIGDHSVIGAGAIVRGAIPPRVVAAGVPAKVIKEFECPDDWIRQ